ncbi:MAG: type II toxin-antitoxin system RelE/ParE family toxin [Thermodesulfobacteriota bacterium]|jgi:mRNA interferase RelE/StbE
MPYSVRLKRSAEKELDGLPAKVHDKIIKAILSLEENPFPRSAKKLHGRQGARIRVGNYRILYVVDHTNKEIEVFSVADRKDVYR